MVNIVQCQHGDLQQRLAWDLEITGLRILPIDRGEWTFVGESCSNFPFSFNIEERKSLEGVSRRSCSTSLWHQHL
jgi:hypothetical protein